MKHIGALIGIAVVVFGATFLFTSDWPLTGSAPQPVAQATAPAQTPPAEQTAQAEPEPEAAPVVDEVAPPSPQAQTQLAVDAAQDETPDAPAAPAEGDAPTADIEALLALGNEQYMVTCAGCHGAEGRDGFAPAFAGNADLADLDYVLNTIVHGFGGMPPFGGALEDEPIAAIATYIRNSWGNDFGPALPEDVAAVR